MIESNNKLFINETDIEIGETTFLVDLDVSGFSNENGKILRYAIWIKEQRVASREQGAWNKEQEACYSE